MDFQGLEIGWTWRRRPYLDREGPAWDADYWTMLEVSRQLGALHRRTHQNHSQIAPQLKKILEDDHKEVGLHTSFMDLGE